MDYISVRGARVHNLKNVDVDIPRNSLVVITGLSGSGKSSLAFDTIYAEGQRRYVESLSSYARQFLGILEKPDVDQIEGLPPAIAIDQKSSSRNPRSTVGTMTDIYDYLRLLFARVGTPHCPKCDLPLKKGEIDGMLDLLLAKPGGSETLLLAPVARAKNGAYSYVLEELEKAGYEKVRVDGEFFSVVEAMDISLDNKREHAIEAVIYEFEVPRDKTGANALRKQLREFVKKALDLGDGVALAHDAATGRDETLSQRYACPKCSYSLPELEPRCFSFNSPLGACNSCGGLGSKMEVDQGLLAPNRKLSLSEGAIQPWFKVFANQKSAWAALTEASKRHKFSLSAPFEKLSKKHVQVVFEGDGDGFPGVVSLLEEKFLNGTSEYTKKEIGKYMQELTCSKCHGARLKEEYLAVRVGEANISEATKMSISELKDFAAALAKDKGEDMAIAKQVLEAIRVRLGNIEGVGLSYLCLDRPATTLSGGEAQRLRLATQLASELVGVAYILDEPSIGLHPKDNKALIDTLKRLRDQGNTVIVVEHDKDMMLAADHVIDVGPDAGACGGQIVSQGTPKEVARDKKSLTGKYLAGTQRIEAPQKPRQGNGKKLVVEGASAHNLKNMTAEFPLGKLVAVSGVSGSGKSTLMVDILSKVLAKHFYRAKEHPKEHKGVKGLDNLDKVITIDQSPIGRTPRSNPATYTGLFNYIRDLFTQLPESKLKGLKAGNFSFNVKEGRCDACAGEGMVRVDMQFLSDMYVQCRSCGGSRYDPKSLEIFYKGKTIADVLDMSVMEAMWFFGEKEIPMIYEKLKVLTEVGLGYVKLGQSATTLSGGEAQRIKLATELSRRSTGRTLYILDEPTTGLHFEDIRHLLELLGKLVDKGNTVIVIEHNMDVIKSADHVIDLGPGGGAEGGQIVAAGTPKEVSKKKTSATGKFLAKEFA